MLSRASEQEDSDSADGACSASKDCERKKKAVFKVEGFVTLHSKYGEHGKQQSQLKI